MNINNKRCKNKLGCACDGTTSYDGDKRLIKPSKGDCNKPGIRYKRSWKEHLCWSNTDICMDRRGSTPRTKLTGYGRLVYENKSGESQEGGIPVLAVMCIGH